MRFDVPRSWLHDLRVVCRRLAPQRGNRQPVIDIALDFDNHGAVGRFVHPLMTVEFRHRALFHAATLLLSLTDLDAVARQRKGDVWFEMADDLSWSMHWNDRDVPQRLPVRTADSPTQTSAVPLEMATNEPRLLGALADVCEVAAETASRYRLDCVCLFGQKGEIVATDGRQLLSATGFEFPWKGDVLVPALPIFAAKVFPTSLSNKIGRTDTHIVLETGFWRLWWPIQTDGRFPDPSAVIPSERLATCSVTVPKYDAAFLLRGLPKLPAAQDHDSPVDVDCNGCMSIRARGENGPATELILDDTKPTGQPLRFATNRNLLARALTFGGPIVHVVNPNKPILATGEQRRYVWQPLTASRAVDVEDCVKVHSRSANEEADASTSTAATRKEDKMAKSKASPAPAVEQEESTTASNGTPATVEGDNSPPDILLGAERLRNDLRDLYGFSVRLVNEIRRERRRHKAVRSTLEALKQLDHIPA